MGILWWLEFCLEFGSQSISETGLGAKILLFNRLVNNSPRSVIGRGARQLFFTMDRRKTDSSWWYRWAGAISQWITAKQNLLSFRLVERSWSTVSFPFISSHDSRYLFYSCYAIWARASLFKGQKDAELFPIFIKHREYSSYPMSQIMVSDLIFHQIRNLYGFGRNSWGFVSSIIRVERFFFIVKW